MSDTNDRQSKIDRIRALPDNLRAAVDGLNSEQLDTTYGPGKWTVRQVVHHLADSHMRGFIRVKVTLTENQPTLKTYDQEVWAETVDGRELPIGPSLAVLDGLHARWCRLFESLTDADWSREANHPEVGTITLEKLLDIYAGHGEGHVASITALRKAKGW